MADSNQQIKSFDEAYDFLCDPFFKIPLDWVFSDEVESEFQGNLKAPYF